MKPGEGGGALKPGGGGALSPSVHSGQSHQVASCKSCDFGGGGGGGGGGG